MGSRIASRLLFWFIYKQVDIFYLAIGKLCDLDISLWLIDRLFLYTLFSSSYISFLFKTKVLFPYALFSSSYISFLYFFCLVSGFFQTSAELPFEAYIVM